jgi:cytochrome c-type protein NapB
MKPSTIRVACVVVMLGLFLSGSAVADLQSLRSADIQATLAAPEILEFNQDKENFPRAFEQQPPLVPHLNEKYTINLSTNKCLDCHMKQPGKDQAKSVEIPESHYLDRAGNRLAKPAGSRHFCTQCHVPQIDAQPLIGSNFESLGD